MELMSEILPPNFVADAFRLDGRVAVVTGGASGLGAAMSAGLTQAGASVAVLDIDREHATQVAASICQAGGDAFALSCDVTKSSAVHEAAAAVMERAGRVDVLVNSAGTAFRSPAED